MSLRTACGRSGERSSGFATQAFGKCLRHPRTQEAKDAGMHLPGESGAYAKITSKQPAYYVYQVYHDTEQFSATGDGAISDADPSSTAPVVYWEARRE